MTDALGPRGSAAGVEQQGGIVGMRDGQGAPRAFRSDVHIEFPGRNGRRDSQIGLGEIRFRTAVFENVGDLLRRQTGVHRDGDKAGGEASVVAGRQLDAVSHVERDAIPRL